jgi:uncharacterized protein
LDEDGTARVIAEMDHNPEWSASALALTEARITLCHAGLDAKDLSEATASLRSDWERMLVVPVDDLCLARAQEIGCAQHVRTLDAVHLAAAERLPRPCRFLTFDARQHAAGAETGLDVMPIDADNG